jgi:hypothetical protein
MAGAAHSTLPSHSCSHADSDPSRGAGLRILGGAPLLTPKSCHSREGGNDEGQMNVSSFMIKFSRIECLLIAIKINADTIL